MYMHFLRNAQGLLGFIHCNAFLEFKQCLGCFVLSLVYKWPMLAIVHSVTQDKAQFNAEMAMT